MKLPFYLELIENETIDINTTASIAHQRLYKIFKQRNQRYNLEYRNCYGVDADSIIPTNVFYDHFAKCFKILVSDDRKISENAYVKSYHARLKFQNSADGKAKAEISYVFNHAYAFSLLAAILVCLAFFIFTLIMPFPPVFKISSGIAFLIIGIMYAANIFTEKKRLNPDIYRLKEAVKKYTDMLNRWND